MTSDELCQLVKSCDLRQKDLAWMMGVCERQARSWMLGKYRVPRTVALVINAYAEGMITARWLRARITDKPPV